MAVSALDSDSADSGLDFVWQVYDLFSEDHFFAMKEPEDKRKYSADPDLLFETKGTGKQFWVDCIYRPSFGRNGNLDVYYADEAKRRLSYYEVLEDPVFMAIGVGGSEYGPETFMFGHLFDFNLNNMSSGACSRVTTHLRQDFVKNIVEEYFKKKEKIDFNMSKKEDTSIRNSENHIVGEISVRKYVKDVLKNQKKIAVPIKDPRLEQMKMISDKIGSVKGNHLDDQQLAAIVSESMTQQVIAGAGTGKTTTLVGKFKYLVKVKGVSPENILVISYSNNTVDDLKKTITSELDEGLDDNIMTIHALGNRLLNKRECVGDRRISLIYGMTMDLILNDNDDARHLIDHVSSMTIFPYPDYSMNHELIPESNLRAFCDILSRNDIGYRYTRSEGYGTDRTEANIEIDSRFGRKVTVWSSDESVKGFGKDPSKAFRFLSDNNIPYRHLNDPEYAKKILIIWKNQICNDIAGIISKCKSTETDIEYLKKENLTFNEDPSKKADIAGRLDLIGKIMQRYIKDYKENDLVDYDDMLIETADALKNGMIPKQHYDHVLVDEYQDVSKIMVRLLYELRRCMGFKLFCVGDDWQSIYSFNGGDIRQMYDFKEIWTEWGISEQYRIETTYRSPRGIVDVTNKFVIKNDKQIKKTIMSGNERPYPFPIALLPSRYNYEIPKQLANRLNFISNSASVFIIGRTRFDVNALKYDGHFDIPPLERDNMSGTMNIIFKRDITDDEGNILEIKEQKITYLTAHSSKGLEADYVFLLADKDKKLFPLTVNEDISSLFPILKEGIEYPEERRLFYVAMTRARKGLFIITRCKENNIHTSESPFVTEIIKDNFRAITGTTPKCTNCGGPMKLMHGKYGIFYGCMSFPKCSGSTIKFREEGLY